MAFASVGWQLSSVPGEAATEHPEGRLKRTSRIYSGAYTVEREVCQFKLVSQQ